ncbi:MAG: Holliday junction resolvase RuvX [Clostridia bacterium]|nr:Holliday junction resolvase RuvX [Clostridia bacterium]
MIIMAIDYGKVRTGLAICDKKEILPFPIGVIEEKNMEILCNKITEKTTENNVELVIIGLPKNMDGSLGESAKSAKKLGEKLKAKTDINIDFWDERKTTVTAHEYLNQTNTRGKKRKSIIDTVSATIILQNYLDYRKKNRV